MTLLIKDATVVTVNTSHEVIESGAVVVEKDRIIAVGDSQTLCRNYANVDDVIDGRDKVVMPGFVSAHNHLGYAVFRGRAEDVGHAPTHRLYLPMSGVITAQERQAIGALAVAELMRGGVTTILEMEEEAELFAPFIETSGIRALIGVMVNDVRLDALARGETVFDETVRASQLEQARGLAERWHGTADGRIHAIVAATGLSTSSPDLLRGIRHCADQFGIGISIHMGFGEQSLVRQIHGCEQFDYAQQHGILGADIIAVHCYEVSEPEIETLAKSGTKVAHCPHMNQFRGEVAPVHAMREQGMQVGLGIDNYFSDYFEVLRSFLAGARIKAHDPELFSAQDALAMGTIDSARVMGLDHEVGSIETGKKADLQIVNMRSLGLTPTNDPVATLVYHGHAKDVETVLVDGQRVVDGGLVRTADQDALLAQAGFAANAAWSRFKSKHGSFVAPAPH